MNVVHTISSNSLQWFDDQEPANQISTVIQRNLEIKNKNKKQNKTKQIS